MQLLSVNGVAHLDRLSPGASAKTGAAGGGHGADVEAADGAKRANGTAPLAQLERESVAGLRQEKVPLSDDPFWDGA